jgi:hypothetical protein
MAVIPKVKTPAPRFLAEDEMFDRMDADYDYEKDDQYHPEDDPDALDNFDDSLLDEEE